MVTAIWFIVTIRLVAEHHVRVNLRFPDPLKDQAVLAVLCLSNVYHRELIALS